MSPSEEIIRHVLADELAVEKELDYAPAEALGHLMEVAERDVDEVAVIIKTTFQHDRVPVGIPSQKFSERLKAHHGSTLHGGSGGFGEILLDEIEDQPAHLREKLSVVSEKYSQTLWQGKGHESVG